MQCKIRGRQQSLPTKLAHRENLCELAVEACCRRGVQRKKHSSLNLSQQTTKGRRKTFGAEKRSGTIRKIRRPVFTTKPTECREKTFVKIVRRLPLESHCRENICGCRFFEKNWKKTSVAKKNVRSADDQEQGFCRRLKTGVSPTIENRGFADDWKQGFPSLFGKLSLSTVPLSHYSTIILVLSLSQQLLVTD